MYSRSDNFEQDYFLFAVFVCCIFLNACTTKTVELSTNAKAISTFESEPTKLASAYFVSELENEDLNSLEPQIAKDANGNAIAIWHTFDGAHNKIKANYFTTLGGWGKASSVETSYSDAYDPQITLDAKGNAIAVWHQMDGSRSNFWANRFVVQAGWGQAKLVKPDLNDGDFPIVSLDGFGNAALSSH
jgi:hypothetical protein